MRLFYLLTLLLLGESLTGQTWSSYTDPDSLFAIEAPGNVLIKEKSVLTGIHDLNVFTYYIKGIDEDPNSLYLINVADYPSGTFPVDSSELVEEFLNESLESLQLNLRGKIDYRQPIHEPAQGFLSRISQHDKDVVVKVKTFIFEDRFYTLQVFTPSDKSLNDSVDRFLHSFRLL